LACVVPVYAAEKEGRQMKNKLFGLALAGAMLLATPFAALAANRGGGGGHFSGGGHSYSAPARGFSGGGRAINNGYRGGYYRGGGGYYRGGVYFGLGAPYGYGYAAPGACGFYDAAGYWHVNPACYGPPAVY
jgi:hypothetical protein